MSKLLFVAQIRETSSVFLKREDRIIQNILGGPGNWRPSGFAWNMKEACSFPVSFKSFFCACRAALSTWRSDPQGSVHNGNQGIALCQVGHSGTGPNPQRDCHICPCPCLVPHEADAEVSPWGPLSGKARRPQVLNCVCAASRTRLAFCEDDGRRRLA